jgi:hypothetical protein
MRTPEALPILSNLAASHARVWAFTESGEDLALCDQAYDLLNRPHYNPLATPAEQARLRANLRSPHTSMSVGDVVVIEDKAGLRAYLCDGYASEDQWTPVPLSKGGWGLGPAEKPTPGPDAHVVTERELAGGRPPCVPCPGCGEPWRTDAFQADGTCGFCPA